jgi:hypothetical protein
MITEVLAAKLLEISTTVLGNAAMETTTLDVPNIAIFSLKDRPFDNDFISLSGLFTREIMLEVKSSAKDYHIEQEALLASIRKRLSTISRGTPILNGEATGLRLLNVGFFPPKDSSDFAVMQINIEVDYIQNYR